MILALIVVSILACTWQDRVVRAQAGTKRGLSPLSERSGRGPASALPPWGPAFALRSLVFTPLNERDRIVTEMARRR